jgi:hypothetical protein
MADNRIFLFKRSSTDTLIIGIGTCASARRVMLTDDEALELAYKLMALGSGGETRGFEKFDGRR